MKRVLAAVLTTMACASDGGATDDALDSSTSTSPMMDESSTHASDVGDGSSSSSTGTSSEGSSTGVVDDSTGSSGAGTDSSSGGIVEDCVAPEILAALQQHAHDLVATAG